MRKTTRNTLLLALVVGLLAFGMYAEVERERGFAPAPLTSLDPQHLKALVVRCPDCRTRRFERRVDGWWMLEPYPLRANGDAVDRLAAVAAAPVRKQLKKADYDLKNLGLDPPVVTLTLDDVRVDVGGEEPIEHDRYARVGDELVRVPDRFGARLLEAPEVEIDLHLIDANATVVQVSVDGKPPRADLAEAWTKAAAAQMQPATDASGTSIKVELADGTSLTFSMRRDGDHYAVRRSDIGVDYLIVEAQAQALLGAN